MTRRSPIPSKPDPQPGTTWFRGRGWSGAYKATDHVARSREMDRQKWVYGITQMEAEFIVLDREAEYRRHREAYEQTGNMAELNLMLAYVSET